jgi:PPP family 3-phenylpropionic acid transporter
LRADNPRQLYPFAALSAAYFAHIGFFNPYLPLWLKEAGYGLLAISLLTSVQSLTRLVAPYGWGWLSDHTGERVKLLRFCATTAMLVSGALWLNLGFAALMLVLLLMFLNTSAMMPMSEASMAHLVSQNGNFDPKRYGRVRLWGSIGFLVTVFAAGAWFEHFGLVHFPAWTVASLALVVLSVWLLPDVKETHAQHAQALPVWPVLRQPRVRWFFLSLFFHVFAHMGIYIFFSLYLDELGYSKTMIGLLWAVSVLVEIAWFFTQSRWLAWLSPRAWLLLCAGVMVLRMGITASAAQSLVWLLLAQALHAITFAAHHSVCIALISEMFPGRLRGRGQALFTVLGYGLPGVLGGLLGGVLSAQFGLVSVFQAAVVCAALATLSAWRVWHISPEPN